MENKNFAYKRGSFFSLLSERIKYWSNEKNYSNLQYIVLNLVVIGVSIVNLVCIYYSDYFLEHQFPGNKMAQAADLLFILYLLVNATFFSLSLIKVVFHNHRPNYLKRKRRELEKTDYYGKRKQYLIIASEIAKTEQDDIDHTAMLILFLKYGNFYIAFILILWKILSLFKKNKRPSLR